MKVPIPFLFASLVVISLFASCAGVPSSASPSSLYSQTPLPAESERENQGAGSRLGTDRVSETQKRIVQAAQSLVGRTRLQFGKVRFYSDCSGFVLAAYYLGGVDLRGEYAKQTGNGVRRLYQIARTHRLLNTDHPPLPGDVVFWDNTYDANGDGKWNDELTHAGIVVTSRTDGTVEYVHYHIRRGIVQERMNLKHTDSVALNAPMRIREAGRSHPGNWSAAQLYRTTGRLWGLSAP